MVFTAVMVSSSITKASSCETFCYSQDHQGSCTNQTWFAELSVPGNLDALSRLGTSKDYVEMQWLLISGSAYDWVIATGFSIVFAIFVTPRGRSWAS